VSHWKCSTSSAGLDDQRHGEVLWRVELVPVAFGGEFTQAGFYLLERSHKVSYLLVIPGHSFMMGTSLSFVCPSFDGVSHSKEMTACHRVVRMVTRPFVVEN